MSDRAEPTIDAPDMCVAAMYRTRCDRVAAMLRSRRDKLDECRSCDLVGREFYDLVIDILEGRE